MYLYIKKLVFMKTEKMLELIVKQLEDSKIENIETIDVSKKTTLTKYIVVGTARSTKHADSSGELLRTELKSLNIAPKKSEGKSIGWVSIDLMDIIVNLFTEEERDYVKLERLWKEEIQ